MATCRVKGYLIALSRAQQYVRVQCVCSACAMHSQCSAVQCSAVQCSAVQCVCSAVCSADVQSIHSPLTQTTHSTQVTHVLTTHVLVTHVLTTHVPDLVAPAARRVVRRRHARVPLAKRGRPAMTRGALSWLSWSRVSLVASRSTK